MHRYIASAHDLPAAPSPISQAVVAGDHCYVSGQLSVDELGVFQQGTAREEAQRAFRNVFAALAAAGFTAREVVYVDVALIDLADIAQVNALFEDNFDIDRRPARTVYQAAALPYGGRVKMQVVAVRER